MLKIRITPILSAITLVAFTALAVEATAAKELEDGSSSAGAIESVEQSISAATSEEAETPTGATEEKTDDVAEQAEEAESYGLDLDNLHIYGYFSVRLEKVFSEPSIVDGKTVYEDAPAEWGIPYFNLMLQHRLAEKVKAFINLNGDGAGNIDVRNVWGEYSPLDYLNIRIGKTYRKFGLYNEILDAVPTYFGIEPPELFDNDHLILSRTTTLMGHGGAYFGSGNINYAVTTDQGEGDPVKGTIPLAFDLNYSFHRDNVTIGTSGYSSNGPTTSDVAVGEGSPNSGVLPWMGRDEFNVLGGYFQGIFGPLTLQAAYWRSPHSGLRDPASVVTVVRNANPPLNSSQLSNFLKNPNLPAVEANVNVDAEYDVETWYFRSGYSFETERGEFVPYFQWDYYSNPETIADKTYGGDNEAGLADDGRFSKSTVGVAYRPIPQVAVKCDFSSHYYKFNGEDVSYPEIRFDVSFVFGQ